MGFLPLFSTNYFELSFLVINLLLFVGFQGADLQFESPLKIVEYPDPRLRAKNKPIDKFDDNLKKLVDEMFDVMYK